MSDPSAFGGYQEGPAAETGGPGRGPGTLPNMGQYKFSPDEMRVLQECNRESFFQRSLPMSTALGLGTLAAVQRGVFKPNPRFGAFPKVTLAVAVGYFLGKLSYQRACADKLMALPGSYIGQLLRDRRDGKIGGRVTSGGGAGAMLGASASDIYSDAGPGSALDLDTDRPPFSDDAYRPDHDGSPIPSPGAREAGEAGEAARPALSYDELRRVNRGQYSDSKQDPYRVEPPSATRPTRAAPPTPPTKPTQPTNRYGDALE